MEAVRDYKIRIENPYQPPYVCYILKNGVTSIEMESGTMPLNGMRTRLEIIERLLAYMHDFGDTSIKIEKL